MLTLRLATFSCENPFARSGLPTIERRGLTTNATKVTAKRVKGVTAKIGASDHCPVAIDLNL
jgi:hypothetical protein